MRGRRTGPGRLTLGLVNTYDMLRFDEAHRRVLVRVGPVALAYDANVALMGFPLQGLKDPARSSALTHGDQVPVPLEDPSDPRQLAAWVASTTSVASEVAPLRVLADGGRLSIWPMPTGGLPPQLGTPVLTTAKPASHRRIDCATVAASLAEGRSQLLLFGLGHKGLPNDLRERIDTHLELSGQSIPFETATAIAAVTAEVITRLRAAQQDRC